MKAATTAIPVASSLWELVYPGSMPIKGMTIIIMSSILFKMSVQDELLSVRATSTTVGNTLASSDRLNVLVLKTTQRTRRHDLLDTVLCTVPSWRTLEAQHGFPFDSQVRK